MSVVSMATYLFISIVIFFFLHMHVSWWLRVVYIDIFLRCSQLSSQYYGSKLFYTMPTVRV